MPDFLSLNIRHGPLIAATAAGLLLAGAAVVAGSYLAERSAAARAAAGWSTNGGTGPEPEPGRSIVVSDGIVRPEAVPADRAFLAGDEEVVGVIVEGRARAYHLASMLDRTGHIVNDVVADRPVTVTYCDLRDCVRIFADPAAAAPLPIAQSGLQDGRMVLRVGGVDYYQDSGEPLEPGGPGLPFAAWPAVRTTWDAWRRDHPETDLYVGRFIQPR